jgi:hypothetical protein
MSYYDRGGIKYHRSTYLYGYSFALNPTRTVLSVTLPDNSDIKILAMDLS